MAKHILFLVHGMGEHCDGWSSDAQDLIKKLYSQYPGLDSIPFDERYEFKELRYDHIFEERRQQWRDNANSLIDELRGAEIGDSLLENLTEIAAAPVDNTFFGTHVLDVVLYRYFQIVADPVRVAVAEQIMEALNATGRTSSLRWSIIAHSLGTAVIHDTLDALYRTGFQTIPDSPLKSTDTRARVIMMVANVSRLLQTNVKAYQSLVKPNKDKAKGLCDYFIIAKHQWDPIIRPKEFNPDDNWPDLETKKARRFVPVTVTAFKEKDVHSLKHYLENPKLHIALFRALTARFMIDSQEEKASIEAYQKDTLEGKYDQLRQDVKKITPGENTDWKGIIGSIQDFLNLVK